jgi:predicted Zn-dependent peptidase
MPASIRRHRRVGPRGGRHERAEQNGIAHFLEHMAFKGTERRTALEIAEAIEDVGATSTPTPRAR